MRAYQNFPPGITAEAAIGELKHCIQLTEIAMQNRLGFGEEMLPDKYFAGLILLIFVPSHPLSIIIQRHSIDLTQEAALELKSEVTDGYKVYKPFRDALISSEEKAIIGEYKNFYMAKTKYSSSI